MISSLYTVHLQYFATGEGWREDIAVLRATDAEAATVAFLDTFGYGGVDSYFGLGVEVTPGIDRSVLSEWLTQQQISRLERTLPFNGRFSMRYYFSIG